MASSLAIPQPYGSSRLRAMAPTSTSSFSGRRTSIRFSEFRGLTDMYGVKVLCVEKDNIEKGIVDFISEHHIKKLVIGAAACRHYSRLQLIIILQPPESFYKMVMLSSSFYVSLLLAIVHTLQNKMPMLYVLAKDISPQSYKKAIRLRLIRTCIVTEGRNKSAVKSQECVFHDIEFSHLLKEGKVYAVKNFVAVSYYYQYKTTQHKYMMRFNQYTTIERHRKKGFPSLLFRIKPIEELLAGKVEEKLLIDVIGRVVEFYSPKDKVIAGFPTQLVDFLIEDSKRNRIKCTLWDEHVPAVMPFFNNHSDGHLIVLLQLCRAKTVDNEVRISSSYTATKVLFNLDCQEFADFRNSLKANCSLLRSISVVSYGHSANNSQSPMVVSTIRDLYERAEVPLYQLKVERNGSITHVENRVAINHLLLQRHTTFVTPARLIGQKGMLDTK
nr:replication factor A protein 1-like isoform X2 [Ipomoea batatas]